MNLPADFQPVIIDLVKVHFPKETFEHQKEIQTVFAEYVFIHLIKELDPKTTEELISHPELTTPTLTRIFKKAFPDIENRIRELFHQFNKENGYNT